MNWIEEKPTKRKTVKINHKHNTRPPAIGPVCGAVFPGAARGGRQTRLQRPGHEDGAAHEQEDEQAGEALLPDAQEARLLPGGGALRLQLQAVDVGDGEHRGRHEPGQAHEGAHAQHHRDHQQVQVVAQPFCKGGQRGRPGDRHSPLS